MHNTFLYDDGSRNPGVFLMAKRFPLPKRFNASLSEAAYARLRALNEKWDLGNNYVLVVLLENLDEFADSEALDAVFHKFISEYGAPANNSVSLK